ncbi:hypothetical protein, partial [Mesorhizobium sp. M7A.F.Ca.CA.004.02.1.1]
MNKTYTLLAIAGLLTLAVIAVAFGLGPDILTTHHSSGLLIAEGAAAVSAQDFKALTDKLAEVTTKFNQKSDELSKKAEEALAEVKNKGELLTATKSDVDKLLIEQTSLKG